MHTLIARVRSFFANASLQYKKMRLLPHVLSRTERIILPLLIGTALVSGFFLVVRVAGYEFVRAPKKGGAYTEAIVGSPSLVNPLFALANPTDLDLTRLIYAGILRKDTNGNVVPDLAERFTVSTDQRTYTIRLKPNARWHDGERVTADDVVFTIERIQDPEMKSPLAQSFRGVSVTKIDDATIQITLKEVFAPFIETLTTGILPKHLWYDVPAATASLAEYNLKPVGTGPFRFASFIKDKKGVLKSYTLERFDEYHGSVPYLTELTFKFYPTFDLALAALTKGEVQGIHLIPKQFKEKIPTNEAHAMNLAFPQYTAVFFNQEKNPALKDKRVREALIHAVDRDRIIRDVLRGEATPLASPIIPGMFSGIESPAAPTFDPAKADALLEGAGWKTISRDAYLAKQRADAEQAQNKKIEQTKTDAAKKQTEKTPNLRDVERDTPPVIAEKKENVPSEETTALDHYRMKNGAALTIRLSTIDHPENVQVANIIKEGWEKLGVQVALDIRGQNFQKDVIQTRDYEALLFGIVVGRDPDPYPFWHSSQRDAAGANLALFANRETDGLLEDARRTNDVGIRAEKYKRFQDIITNELPADFLFTPTYTYLIGNALQGFGVTSIAKPDDRFAQVTEWYVKTHWVLKKK
ncbi:peptide ABC transporter substrate-binding protein [Candidatus Uhrbacteria bacterium]|nr:peptide ABC transporter substrate-binding protein [Candidatus Uhrbacteria bacterium]